VCNIQQGSIGAAAMVMPPTAMYAADATASFNGMMTAAGHLPTVQTGNTGMMMINADDAASAGWSSTNADVSNYLSAKAAHMVCSSICSCSRPFTVSQDHEVHTIMCQSLTFSSAAQPFIWFSCLSYLCTKDMELLTSSHSAILNS